MRREAIDACYAVSVVLDEIERAVEAAGASGYEEAVEEARRRTEEEGLIARMGRILAAATAEVF